MGADGCVAILNWVGECCWSLPGHYNYICLWNDLAIDLINTTKYNALNKTKFKNCITLFNCYWKFYNCVPSVHATLYIINFYQLRFKKISILFYKFYISSFRTYCLIFIFILLWTIGYMFTIRNNYFLSLLETNRTLCFYSFHQALLLFFALIRPLAEKWLASIRTSLFQPSPAARTFDKNSSSEQMKSWHR